MLRKLHHWGQDNRSSFWFIPAVMVLDAVAFTIVLVTVDATVDLPVVGCWPLLFGASAPRVASLLTAVAGSMITVAGVVFSITLMALSLTSDLQSVHYPWPELRKSVGRSLRPDPAEWCRQRRHYGGDARRYAHHRRSDCRSRPTAGVKMKMTGKNFRVPEGEKVYLEKWPTCVEPVYVSNIPVRRNWTMVFSGTRLAVHRNVGGSASSIVPPTRRCSSFMSILRFSTAKVCRMGYSTSRPSGGSGINPLSIWRPISTATVPGTSNSSCIFQRKMRRDYHHPKVRQAGLPDMTESVIAPFVSIVFFT